MTPIDLIEMDESELNEDEQKRLAQALLSEAWDDGMLQGVDADIMANAALFTALTDLVEAYGEEPVAELADGLADRIRAGEFTLNRVTN